MKVEQIEPKPSFKPVVITLESQEEVDALQGVFQCNRISVILESALGRRPYEFLSAFATSRHLHYHASIVNLLK